ncbi:hypothetical protein AB0J37_36725, partial [Microbispora rosea]
MARMDWLRDADRPSLFNFVFWAMTAILAAGLAQAAVTRPAAPLQIVLFGGNLALVAALWPALPWSRTRG